MGLWGAHEKNPEDSLALWFLGLDSWGERPLPAPENDAWEALLELNPQNGWVELAVSLRRTERGDVSEGRMLFHAARGFPQGHVYSAVAESRLIEFLSDTRRLTASDLGAAREILKAAPRPPYLAWLDALESVYLRPLKRHPYDIRIRGWEASQGLRRLGHSLAIQSREAKSIWGLSHRDEALGLALEWRAWQFLQVYQETFPQQRDLAWGWGRGVDPQNEGERTAAELRSLLPRGTDSVGARTHLSQRDWADWDRVFQRWKNSEERFASEGNSIDPVGSAGAVDADLHPTLVFQKIKRLCPE
jgi:hypothetical protein